jgi:hypothetical protein
MSSMLRNTMLALVMLGFLSSPAWAQDSHPDGREWDASARAPRNTSAEHGPGDRALETAERLGPVPLR